LWHVLGVMCQSVRVSGFRVLGVKVSGFRVILFFVCDEDNRNRGLEQVKKLTF